jgi:hypothetical protein
MKRSIHFLYFWDHCLASPFAMGLLICLDRSRLDCLPIAVLLHVVNDLSHREKVGALAHGIRLGRG